MSHDTQCLKIVYFCFPSEEFRFFYCQACLAPQRTFPLWDRQALCSRTSSLWGQFFFPLQKVEILAISLIPSPLQSQDCSRHTTEDEDREQWENMRAGAEGTESSSHRPCSSDILEISHLPYRANGTLTLGTCIKMKMAEILSVFMNGLWSPRSWSSAAQPLRLCSLHYKRGHLFCLKTPCFGMLG